MDSVGAYEAKTHLPKLLARVIKGENDNDNQARSAIGRSAASAIFEEGVASTGHCRNAEIPRQAYA